MAISRTAFIDAFTAAGRRLWVVGGAVRDELLGRPGHDEDFATDALPEETERIALSAGARVTTVGKQWGTIGVNLDGRWTEVTTLRGDSYSAGARWPDVVFGSTIEEDVARRDFTINALARDARSDEIIDLFGGRDDLASGLIRAVGEPAERFREDPLRILRGIRFASQLDFAIEARTFDGMVETIDLLPTLSQERITSEIDRLLAGIAPARGLELLRETGALQRILPELAPMIGCEQNSFHRFDVWGHTVATVAAIGGDDPGVLRWAALLHDLGKPAVRHVKASGEWGFYRHETVGAELAAPLLDRLRMGRREASSIVHLIRRHMDRPDPSDARSVRRFMRKSEGAWANLIALKRADNASHTYDDAAYHDLLEAACERAAADDAELLRAASPLTGDDLVALFNRPAGPWIRAVKEHLSGLVLDGELAPADRGTAEQIARRFVSTDS